MTVAPRATNQITSPRLPSAAPRRMTTSGFMYWVIPTTGNPSGLCISIPSFQSSEEEVALRRCHAILETITSVGKGAYRYTYNGVIYTDVCVISGDHDVMELINNRNTPNARKYQIIARPYPFPHVPTCLVIAAA